MIKCLFDILFSFLFFVLFSPLMALIIIAILLDSKGPAFFNQERVGKDGKTFVLHKFRTMRTSSQGPQITIGADPRVTRVGRFLRKYKLDELPQLLNIIKGEMSFIGPRPEVSRYVAMYNDEQKPVLSVRPGLSDPASLVYINEAELLGRAEDPEKMYIEEIMPAKLELNLKYIQERSFVKDIQLIFRTITKVFSNPSTHLQS